MQILKMILIVVGLAILLVSAVTIVRYFMWKDQRLDELAAASEVVQTARGPMEYRWWGEGETVMLFLHGSPGGYDQYAPRPDENANAIRVLSVSRPGYLRTPIDTGHTPEQQADAYAALLDALDISQVIVLAASGGGPSGITFAAKYPGRTLGLITTAAVSQSMEIDLEEQPPAIARLLQNDFMSWLSLGMLGDEALVGMIVTGDDNQRRILSDPEKLASLRRAVLASQPPSLRQAGMDNDTVNMAAIDLPLSELLVPTLITHGTADTNVPFAFSEELAGRVPNAEFSVFEGADHFMSFSHRDEYNAVVDQFVASLIK